MNGFDFNLSFLRQDLPDFLDRFCLSWFPEETKKTQSAKGAQVRLMAEDLLPVNPV
jgi:hypothetical protein